MNSACRSAVADRQASAAASNWRDGFLLDCADTMTELPIPGSWLACPRCERTPLVEVEGHYRCDACREPFDYFKPF